MKRFLCLILALFLCSALLFSCQPNTPQGTAGSSALRLSDFVGVWTNDANDLYYRFTASGLWYRYNSDGEVESKGDVSFDGSIFTLIDENGSTHYLNCSDQSSFLDSEKVSFHRTDSPSSLVSASGYEDYFNTWLEDANTLGNRLVIGEPDRWSYTDPNGKVLSEGSFYAYANEEENLYLHLEESGDFYATLSLTEKCLIFQRHIEDRVIQTEFATEENSKPRSFYFKEKGIEINYYLGEGPRLLRNGGAAFNEAHDYKKMPVICSIKSVQDLVSNGQRQVEIVVNYEFKKSDMPSLNGSKIYNSVRFSQYDYYTGELFYLDDSTGTEHLQSRWVTEHDGQSYQIRCDFTSYWDYPNNDDVMVRWNGTYRLVFPEDYDGFVICLRPVFNSYSAQVSGSITPQEGTLLLEDLGEDVDKALYCRIEKKTIQVSKTSD